MLTPIDSTRSNANHFLNKITSFAKSGASLVYQRLCSLWQGNSGSILESLDDDVLRIVLKNLSTKDILSFLSTCKTTLSLPFRIDKVVLDSAHLEEIIQCDQVDLPTLTRHYLSAKHIKIRNLAHKDMPENFPPIISAVKRLTLGSPSRLPISMSQLVHLEHLTIKIDPAKYSLTTLLSIPKPEIISRFLQDIDLPKLKTLSLQLPSGTRMKKVWAKDNSLDLLVISYLQFFTVFPSLEKLSFSPTNTLNKPLFRLSLEPESKFISLEYCTNGLLAIQDFLGAYSSKCENWSIELKTETSFFPIYLKNNRFKSIHLNGQNIKELESHFFQHLSTVYSLELKVHDELARRIREEPENYSFEKWCPQLTKLIVNGIDLLAERKGYEQN